MASDIYNHLSNYSQQGRSILGGIHQDQLKSNTVRAKIMKDLVSIGKDSISSDVGEIIGDFFESNRAEKYGKKLTKSFLNPQEMQATAMVMSQFDVRFQSWFAEIKSFLSQVSEQKPNLVQPGNSKILFRKFNPVFRCTKTETKIKRVLAALDEVSSLPLVYNMSLLTEKEIKEKEKKMPYDTLQSLENSLREFISMELSKITPDWWIQRVPADVRQHAEERKAKDEKLWPWHQEKNLQLIYYVDFPDYIKIITRKDNWKDVFAPIIRDKDAVSTKLRELEPVRNNIAHSREISTHAREKLEIYAREINAAMKK